MSTFKEEKRKNHFNFQYKKEGLWEDYYWSNGQACSKGYYKNGEREGFWEYYDYNGELKYKEFYVNI